MLIQAVLYTSHCLRVCAHIKTCSSVCSSVTNSSITLSTNVKKKNNKKLSI